MQRYTVNLHMPGLQARRLLVPFSSSSTIEDFASEVHSRSERLGISTSGSRLQFRLGTADGPEIDADDSLEHVVLDPSSEPLHVSVTGCTAQRDDPGTGCLTAGDETQVFSILDIPEPSSGGFRIRLITPAIAQQGDVSKIAPISRRLPATITVDQIRKIALQHLGLPAATTSVCDKVGYCNCGFANSLHNETTLKVASDNDVDPATSFLFVHSAGEVTRLSCDATSQNALLARGLAYAQERLGSDVATDMTLSVHRSPNIQGTAIVTLCSRSKHGSMAGASSSTLETTMRLDLHTTEAPLDTPLSHLSMAELGLEDMLVEGVLDVYAVSRKYTSLTSHSTSLGQATIFGTASHWEPHVQQTDRGMAMFLSTLRVVCSRLRGREANLHMQDAVLRLFHSLTNFPPTVRAMHILARNETPTPSECAALAQTFYHVLKRYLPPRIISFDDSRVFEVSRLFFGLLLEKAKRFHRVHAEDASHPYLTSLKSVTLANEETTEPFFFPVDTTVGIFEQGHLDAVKAGLVEFKDPSLANGLAELSLDGRTRRAILLGGGTKIRSIVFDTDILYSNDSFHESSSDIVAAEMELSHLAVVCSRNNLAVVAPARLTSSSSPALTLDSDGLLSCYLGRQPCGTPGKDFVIFQPTKGGDVTIDIAIVTQLLAPILEARHTDGSAVFDSPGDTAQRKIEKPDEILMVCVDCSASMGDSIDFSDMMDETTPEAHETPLLEQFNLTSETRSMSSTLDEVKEWIMMHESFDDMIATVNHAQHVKQAVIATQLLNELAYLAGKELKHQEGISSNRRRFTFVHRTQAEETTCLRIESLKKFIIGINEHRVALVDWILFRSRMLSSNDDSWLWHIGDPIPVNSTQPISFASDALELSIPHDYLCAITYELMSDPVDTADGHIYDRAAIHQWLEINETSPKTGLHLANTRLTARRVLMRDINRWINGDDFLDQTEGQSGLDIGFSSRLGTFHRTVPSGITCEELYEVVFRALRGRHPNFDIRIQGRLATLATSNDAASTKGLLDGSIVNITLPEANGSSLHDMTDKCLVKVYHNSRRCLFSYWVPKTTDLSVASVLYKYWRKVWGLSGSLHDVRVWTGMTDSGDSRLRGSICKPWEKLSRYLGPDSAKGCLEDESVFDDPHAPYHGVLKVYICKKSPKSSRLRTSRMDVLKQMFDQFVNRTIAYNYNTHLGLITFDSTARVARQLTDVVEDFRATVNELKPESDTALWDGLALARHQLDRYAANYPQATKRILCISDGEDTKSTREPAQLCDDLIRSKIVVDSFCLGNVNHRKLLAVSHLTGGYKFVPSTLTQAMDIVELEPVLALKDREDASPPTAVYRSSIWSRFLQAQQSAMPEAVTADVFPQRRAHPSLGDDVVELSTARRMASSSRTGANMLRHSRLLNEIQNIIAKPHEFINVYVSERDISFWKVIMQGPPDSPYASGTFLLYLDMDESYPTFAPKGRFVTPIYHVNVNRNGRICHSICKSFFVMKVDRNWTADTTCADILNSIYGLLLVPDYSDPVNVVGTLAYHGDQVEFADAVRAHINKHANKTSQQWRRELLGHE